MSTIPQVYHYSHHHLLWANGIAYLAEHNARIVSFVGAATAADVSDSQEPRTLLQFIFDILCSLTQTSWLAGWLVAIINISCGSARPVNHATGTVCVQSLTWVHLYINPPTVVFVHQKLQ